MKETFSGAFFHGIKTVIAMAVSLFLFETVLYGGLAAVAFFMGRELAQAEYRYLVSNGLRRADSSMFVGFRPDAWNLKSVLDWVSPLILAFLGVQVLP